MRLTDSSVELKEKRNIEIIKDYFDLLTPGVKKGYVAKKVSEKYFLSPATIAQIIQDYNLTSKKKKTKKK